MPRKSYRKRCQSMLIDTHAHLTDDKIDAKKVISSMEKDRLEKIICVGFDMQSSEESLALAKKEPNIYAAVGIHPSDVAQATERDMQRLVEMASDKKTVAIGEIGLDYHYDDDRDTQKKWLIRQLEVVKECNLPAIFHLRDAYADMYEIIKEYRDRLTAGAVMHCFSGSLETAYNYLDMGFYISFSGSATFKNAHKFSEIVPEIPKDRLLVETDCPYLAPTPLRGTVNVPKNVWLTAQKIAELRNCELSEIEEITVNNAYALFRKMER